ncbi:MAG: hypothetical protein M3Y13_12515 [Armatimonadota bacterium]|nr:hypothetical protein [Armatimonadota bacterium]
MVGYDFQQESPKVEQVLRRAFPSNAIIEMEEGYGGRVRAKVVSSRLNGMREQEKQNYLWDILHTELGEDSQSIAFVLAYGTDEL